MQTYLDFVREKLPAANNLMIETRVDFSAYVPGGFGTADAIIDDLDAGKLTICDLKFGGTLVDAEHNPQLMLYALGALDFFSLVAEFEVVEMCIIQPRRDHISTFTQTPAELRAWAREYVVQQAAAAMAAYEQGGDNALKRPGEVQCKWCKGFARCTAARDLVEEIAVDGFTNIDDDQALDFLANALPMTGFVKAWAKAVEAAAKERLERGQKLRGYKLVEGRANRAWLDEAAAEKALRRKFKIDQVAPRTLISPAKAEKLLGKNSRLIADHVVKPPGAPTVVPETDKRPALSSALDGFSPVNESTENE